VEISGGFGVIDMGLLRVIRLLALRKKMPLREIARRTGLFRIEAIEAPSVRDQWLRDQKISAGGHR